MLTIHAGEPNLSAVVNKLKQLYEKLQPNTSGALPPAWRQIHGETRTVSFLEMKARIEKIGS